MFRLIPAPIHRAVLGVAFKLRHRYRKWSGRPIRGCSVVVSDLDGAILLVRHSYGPKVWGLPGGGVARGESPEDTARREVKEEVGVELTNLTALGTIEEEISGSQHISYLFAGVADVRPKADNREVIEARFFPPHSLPEPLGTLTRSRLAAWRERKLQQR